MLNLSNCSEDKNSFKSKPKFIGVTLRLQQTTCFLVNLLSLNNESLKECKTKIKIKKIVITKRKLLVASHTFLSKLLN